MGQALIPQRNFESSQAANFRLYVLAGCEQLGQTELRQLADEIHQKARDRQGQRSSLTLYAQARYAEASGSSPH
jgi:hypothetical protein